jgi:hypothetical protein
MTIDFKFILGDFAYDKFGNKVIVKFLGFDDGGIQYHVQQASGIMYWTKEKDLKHD